MRIGKLKLRIVHSGKLEGGARIECIYASI